MDLGHSHNLLSLTGDPGQVGLLSVSLLCLAKYRGCFPKGCLKD